MKVSWVVAVVCVALCSLRVDGQEAERYSRLNAFSGFAEYSNNSNHVRWGVAEGRKLIEAGVTYSRRMPRVVGGLTRYGSWYYEVEVTPLAFLRDQTSTYSVQATNYSGSSTQQVGGRCEPSTFTVPGEFTTTIACGTEWTYMGGFRPVGLRYNFLPRHRVQPFVDQHLGLLVATRDVPVADSSSVNFTFEFGAGVEIFRDHARSFAVEYRLHHLSNDYMGNNNPGVDSQILKVTYSFGRR